MTEYVGWIEALYKNQNLVGSNPFEDSIKNQPSQIAIKGQQQQPKSLLWDRKTTG